MTIRGKAEAGVRVAVVVARWNELVTKALLEGALDTLSQAGVAEPTVVHVPGAWEIPAAAAALLEKDEVDAVVALGCILQGETSHAAQLAGDVAGALMGLQVQHRVPVTWGVLTPDTLDQALDRAGMKHGHKGREAAASALEMVSVLRQLA